MKPLADQYLEIVCDKEFPNDFTTQDKIVVIDFISWGESSENPTPRVKKWLKENMNLHIKGKK